MNYHFLKLIVTISLTLLLAILYSGCQEEKGTQSTPASRISGGTTNSSTNTSTNSTSSTINVIQIVTRADSVAGSFDNTAVPSSGGVAVKATRVFDSNGSLIPTASIPSWYSESRVFLTSTRSSSGSPTFVGADTHCAYFDTTSTDNNPDSSGYYTIDGYNATASGVTSDSDQCAGTAASELNQLSTYIRIDRRFMSETDKLQVIIKAKAIDNPNTAPTSSSCVVGGFFDPSACSNQYYALTMRTSPGAAAKPFFILFPSAKALDLLSESVLLPIHLDQTITTISIDRVKGGIILYGITLIRL